MSGGAGGSIMAMIQTLRNNKMLLNKRTPFFKKKHNYLRFKRYKSHKLNSFANRTPLSEEQQLRIQKEFRNKSRINTIATIILSIACLGLVVVGFLSLLSVKSYRPVYKEQINTVVYSKLKPQPYRDNMKLGILKLKEKDYFMASGNFKRALQIKPANFEAQYFLTKSYCLSCFHRKQACGIAEKKVDENQTKYPDEYLFVALEKYLPK